MSDIHVPDVFEPLLGFRVWRYREDDHTLWSVSHGDPKKNDTKRMLLSNSTPNGYWPPRNGPNEASVLEGKCLKDKEHSVPDSDCSCGIYATYDINTIANYIRQGPVMGLVQGYGTTVRGEPDDNTLGGFRSEKAKIVAFFELVTEFTIPHRQLRKVADRYNVPLIVPWSTLADDYIAAVRAGTLVELDKQNRATQEN